MRSKLLLAVFALLAMTALLHAQPFVACLEDFDFPLMTTCAGTTPLPDSVVVTIFWDWNANGPDAADSLLHICDLPPNCETGPGGTYNFGSFFINGGILGIGAGLFATDPCLASVGSTPTVPRYYLVVRYHGVGEWTVWTSEVLTFQVGPNEPNITVWTCAEFPDTGGTPCTPSHNLVLHPTQDIGNQDADTCARICPDSVISVCVGPLVSPSRFPIVHVFPGCGADTCTPGSGWLFDTTMWVYTNIGGQNFYCNTITGAPNATPGCVLVDLDFILPVTLGSVAIEPRDNAVSVKWSTHSETGAARFEILRDGERVGFKEATNTPTAHEYSFMDETAVNGTTYEYQLVLVNDDRTTTVLATEKVTPSAEHALVTEYALHQNYPNPFNPTTSIRFDLVEKNFVTLKIYTITGREVATLVNSERSAGVHIVNFDAANLTSGVYFYTVKVGNVYDATKKMLLLK